MGALVLLCILYTGMYYNTYVRRAHSVRRTHPYTLTHTV